ncbi:MAG TPA: hypothetical protein VGO93_25015 [Candidatus Xenobia bacterium]
MLTCRWPVYAAHGSVAFNHWLHGELTELAAAVHRRLGANFIALFLGGAYGCGEGGIAWRKGIETPYHDLDLFLVVHARLGVARLLAPLKQSWEERLGVGVEFGRPLLPSEAERLPRRLNFHEFEHGHVLLAGAARVACAREPERAFMLGGVRVEGWDANNLLPPIEASRLLVNRGAGLLRAWRICAGLEALPEPDFIRRRAYQAILAMGDALLLSHDRFEPSYRMRGERLPQLLREHQQLARWGLLPLYGRALRFKLTPDLVPDLVDLDHVTDLWASIFLHVESRRCGRVFPTVVGYCQDPHLREPHLSRPWRWPFNVWHNSQVGEWSVVHPRECLYRHLPGLLWHRRTLDPQWQRESKRLMQLWLRHRS